MGWEAVAGIWLKGGSEMEARNHFNFFEAQSHLGYVISLINFQKVFVVKLMD